MRAHRASQVIATGVALLVSAGIQAAREGDLDPSFFTVGYQVVAGDVAEDERPIGLVALPDGKTLVASAVEAASGETVVLARFRADGGADTVFGLAGIVRINLPVREWSAMTVGPDNKIVVVGTLTSSSTDYDMVVIRLLSDGDFDATFAPGIFAGLTSISFASGTAGSYDFGNAVVVQSDNKIVVAGSASELSGMAIARLNVNGSLDNSFSGDGKLVVPIPLGGGNFSSAQSVTLVPAFFGTGDIIVGGSADYGTSGDKDFAVVRMSPAGILDTTFSGDGIATVAFDLGGNKSDIAYSAAVPISDDKLVLCGRAANGATSSRSGVAKLNRNGSLDLGFSLDGKLDFGIAGLSGSNEQVRQVFAAFDGRVTVGTQSSEFAVTRLLPNGAFDPTFDNGSAGPGQVTHDFYASGPELSQLRCMDLDVQGRLLLAGSVLSTADYDTGVMRLLGERIFSNGFQPLP